MGNPTTYLGHALTWGKIRQLESYRIDSNTLLTYAYDAGGVRIRKGAVSYQVDGNRILRETRPAGTITYEYGNGGVCGFQYDNTKYYYEKNLQGDITGIYDAGGNLKAEYIYDAWGNPVIAVDIDGIGTLNPFRYRGYYYDTETGLYYLNSRYYDPRTCRFISADSIIGANGDIIGYNLFAYCSNNPIMYTDPSGKGKIWDWIKNTAHDVGNWFSNTFGGAIYASNSYEAIKFETLYGGIESGASASKVIAGDNSKPITFYAQNASEWWKFWEYKIGVNVNIGDGGFNVGRGIGENTLAVCANNTSLEFITGIMKLGVVVSEDVDFKNKTAGIYTHAYIRPWSIAATAAAVYYTGGAVVPVVTTPLAPA